MNLKRVGEVRPSQLLWTYGPGALVDLPNLSVLTMGIDKWDKDRCPTVQEARLLNAVRSRLGPQVGSLRMPPFHSGDSDDRFSAEAMVGVPVRAFPRYLRCVACGLLSPFDAGLFDCKENIYRPERTRFVHLGCRGSKGDKSPRDMDAVPARFLLACSHGHLDDFPWHYFVHSGHSDCPGILSFFESEASLQTENLWVKCSECNAARNMSHAFGDLGKQNLPACRGRHPHLDKYDEECDEQPRAVLLGATNSWFPITLSALAIPQAKNPLDQLVIDGWEYFIDLKSIQEVILTIKAIKISGGLPGVEQFTPEKIFKAIEDYRSGSDGGAGETDIKVAEWEVLTARNPPSDYPHFMSKVVFSPKNLSPPISRVLLLERLREVNALLGFTRIEQPGEMNLDGEMPEMARLSRDAPDWVPVGEVHGEGIFIQFDEEVIASWEKNPAVKALDTQFFEGHRGWRNARKLDPNEGYPGVRYAMIHSFAHVLIRELALECGYNASSIRERIYACPGNDEMVPQAGILIYTAAADSDGTLGGLVELGKPENLGRLISQALNRTKICASDPLCSEHDPAKDRSLHGAACHACSFVSETSCERGNRYLDRALLVPTVENTEAAFFKEI